MDWAHDLADWPLSQYSRQVLHKPHRWHLQDVGAGPLLLLIHGAGGATHSWRHLIPLLSPHFRIVAIDLPGQGFTQLGARHRCGLDAMAEDILSLCRAENLHPRAIIGHSAGGAIALHMAELMGPHPPQIIGINAALEPFGGVPGILFPLMAKTIAALPLAADLFSATASQGKRVERIIKGTGSSLSPEDIAYYRKLVASRSHVNATLLMMAQWRLEPLLERLLGNVAETVLIVGDRDTAVQPSTSKNAAAKMPNAVCKVLRGLGHLAHEEDAARVADVILAALETDEQH